MQILQISNDGHKNWPKHVVVHITLFNLQDTEQYKLIKKGTKHTYFEVSPAETPSKLQAFPFMKLSTNKRYDWSSKISQ